MQLTARYPKALDRLWSSSDTSSFNGGMSGRLGKLSTGQFSQSIGNNISTGKKNWQRNEENETHIQLESMVLRSFVQEMLPKEDTGTFGAGIAGAYWRSILVDEIAEAVARSGGLGIANTVLKNIDANPQE